MLEAALVVSRWLFLGLLSLFLWQVYRVALSELRLTARAAARPAPSGEPRLAALAGTGMAAPGRIYPVRGEVTLGRHEDNTIVLEDTYASGHHARVWTEGGSGWLEEIKATNGTFVDGRRVQGRTKLRDGAEIAIGTTKLRFGQ